MKERIKNKWVKALRSGEYKQCKGQLKRNGKFCCLGVLSEISKLDYMKISGGLNYRVVAWADMNSYLGRIQMYDADFGYISLSKLNDYGIGVDHDPFTFDEIADVIEMTWEEL